MKWLIHFLIKSKSLMDKSDLWNISFHFKQYLVVLKTTIEIHFGYTVLLTTI